MLQYDTGSSQEISERQDPTESMPPQLLTVNEPLPLQECKNKQ